MQDEQKKKGKMAIYADCESKRRARLKWRKSRKGQIWDHVYYSDMEAMSFKKLRRKLDHKQNYVVEYTNKKGNPQHKVNVKGIEPK